LEVSGDKKNTWISSDISPLLLHIVSKFVQALVITHNENFQALAVEAYILLPKPFLDPSHPPHSPDLAPLDFHEVQKWLLDLGFDNVIRWKSLVCFFQFAKHGEVQGG
jgi:hypothetical protein